MDAKSKVFLFNIIFKQCKYDKREKTNNTSY